VSGVSHCVQPQAETSNIRHMTATECTQEHRPEAANQNTHSLNPSSAAVRTLLRMFTASVVLIAMTACNTGQEPSSEQEQSDERRVREYDAQETQEAFDDQDRDDYQRMQATMWADIEAEPATESAAENELRDKDAMRQCLLSGTLPALCALDPYDPYGEPVSQMVLCSGGAGDRHPLRPGSPRSR